MTIGAKIRLLMIFLVATLITTSVISFWSSNKFIGQVSDLVEVQLPGVTNMILADMMHDGIRANVYSAILASKSKDPETHKAVKDESNEFAANIRNHIAELDKLHLREETKKAIAPALPKIEAYVSSAQEIVDTALTGEEDKAKALLPGFNEKFEALEKDLGVLGDLINEDAAKSSGVSKVIEKNATYLNIVSLVIGIILLIFFSRVIKEQQSQLSVIINKLVIEARRINETAINLTTSSQNLSASTTEQSTAFQESAAALEEISATVSITEANSRKLDSNAKVSYESASNGKMTIEQMLVSMDTINDSNNKMMQQMDEGNKKISEIVTVIGEIENKTKVINDIVFQTKLLSFNASVEAARAGEQGKGFAVVAEEVGNLAQMSGNAAKEISDMLTTSMSTVTSIVNDSKSKVETLAHDSRAKVEQGIDIANKCGNALEEIVHQASSINELISEITTAVKEQSKGIVEVSNAMGLLDQASNRNAITSRENLASSEELQDQVQKLESVIASLSSMMTSNKTTT